MSDRAAIVNRAHKLATDFPYLAENCLSILTKSGEQVRFRLNKAQRIVHERMEAQKRRTGKVRAIVLKARQWGCSTYVEGRFFGHCIMQSGVSSFILTHSNPATDNLFAMTRRFYDSLPPPLKPATIVSNVKELRFATDSGIAVATAGAKGAGRARTIQYLHGSEVAHWPNAAEHMAGLLQAVPDATGTEIVLESTAAGVGGLFYDMVKAAERGEGGYELIFVPWFWHEEYAAEPPADWQLPEGFREYARVHELTPEQVHWAWRKNGELSQACGASPDEVCWLFRQEYPATADEAFHGGGHEAFISPELVVKARKATVPDQSQAPLVLGIDIARGGGDKTRIIDRRGRCAGHRVNLTIDKNDLMEVAGIVAREIDRHRPDGTFVDGTGLGAGVYDRLKERNYRRVWLVNFGSKARDDRQYANKRAEMWGRLRDWLADEGGADIIDTDEMQSSLCAPGYKFNSNSQLLLESKEDMRTRLRFSPDVGDALALTFAENIKRADAYRRPPPMRANSAYNPLRWGR